MAASNPPKVNSEFVERYQLELARNPRSRVFAPLAEAYRKMGLMDEAKRICRFGCQANPDFAGGHVAYAKVLLDSKAPLDALIHLERAAKLSPDNLLAHHLLGETLIELRKPKEALKAFKMVLFLDPDNERAKQAVKKWEFLTADEYGEDVFDMKPATGVPNQADEELEELLSEATSSGSKVPNARLDLQQRHTKALERAVSLADAFTVRNDLEAAVRVLEDARRLLGPMSEIENRYRLLSRRLQSASIDEDEGEREREGEDSPQDQRLVMTPPPPLKTDQKREILETLLRRIMERRA